MRGRVEQQPVSFCAYEEVGDDEKGEEDHSGSDDDLPEGLAFRFGGRNWWGDLGHNNSMRLADQDVALA